MANRIVVGRHSVMEALKVRPHAVSALYTGETFDSKKWSDEVKTLAKRVGLSLTPKKESFFNKLSKNTQGIACKVTENPKWPNEDGKECFILVLDSVEDTQNLGAILRTAWLMGVDGILMSVKDSAPLNPTACKVACGGAEHIPIMRVQNIKNELKGFKAKGFWSYSLVVDEEMQDIRDAPKSRKTILIAGAEEKGIKPALIKASDFKVYIPQTDSTASFNISVSVAMGIWSLK